MIDMELLGVKEGVAIVHCNGMGQRDGGSTVVMCRQMNQPTNQPADRTNCGNISLSTTHNNVARLASFAATDT